MEHQLQISGEEGLSRLRDEMRHLTQPDAAASPFLVAETERVILDGIIGALLGTREDRSISAPTARARLSGYPYDPNRVSRMRELHATLSVRTFATVADPAPAGRAAVNLAFLDAYFSNYIEGTTFEVGEARALIFEACSPLAAQQTLTTCKRPMTWCEIPISCEQVRAHGKTPTRSLLAWRRPTRPSCEKDRRSGRVMFPRGPSSDAQTRPRRAIAANTDVRAAVRQRSSL